jgi:hypothetical protein
MLSIPTHNPLLPMTQTQAAIEQINLGYNDQQDRLLLKLGLVDKTEISVWITRRICKSMWSLLQGANMSLSPSAPTMQPLPDIAVSSKDQAIQSFEREVAEQKVIENMDFKSEYLTDRQTRTEEPLLAIQCMTITIEGQAPHLELQCLGGQAVKIALNNELVHAITNMMQLATREAGWDLLMVTEKTQISLASGQSLLH